MVGVEGPVDRELEISKDLMQLVDVVVQSRSPHASGQPGRFDQLEVLSVEVVDLLEPLVGVVDRPDREVSVSERGKPGAVPVVGLDSSVDLELQPAKPVL